MFHIAFSIFHPFKKEEIEYYEQLARVRSRNILAQQKATEFTAITSIHQISFLEKLFSLLKTSKPITLYVIHGKQHPGVGLLQFLVEPQKAQWIYYDEDGHMLLTRGNSVFNWWDSVTKQVDNFDVLVEGSALVDAIPDKHRRVYKKYFSEDLAPAIPTNEWGHYQSTASYGKHYRPIQPQRTEDGTFYLHQGARVAYSTGRGLWSLHHDLHVGPNAIRPIIEEKVTHKVFSLEEYSPDLSLKIQQVGKDLLDELEIEKFVHVNGEWTKQPVVYHFSIYKSLLSF